MYLLKSLQCFPRHLEGDLNALPWPARPVHFCDITIRLPSSPRTAVLLLAFFLFHQGSQLLPALEYMSLWPSHDWFALIIQVLSQMTPANMPFLTIFHFLSLSIT